MILTVALFSQLVIGGYSSGGGNYRGQVRNSLNMILYPAYLLYRIINGQEDGDSYGSGTRTRPAK